MRHKPNFRRERIINEHLLDYIDQVKDSDRNKEIVKKYVAGESFKALSEEYGITDGRLGAIVAEYISKVGRLLKQQRMK